MSKFMDDFIGKEVCLNNNGRAIIFGKYPEHLQTGYRKDNPYYGMSYFTELSGDGWLNENWTENGRNDGNGWTDKSVKCLWDERPKVHEYKFYIAFCREDNQIISYIY